MVITSACEWNSTESAAAHSYYKIANIEEWVEIMLLDGKMAESQFCILTNAINQGQIEGPLMSSKIKFFSQKI